MGNFCPNPKSICKKLQKKIQTIQKNCKEIGKKIEKKLRKIIVKKSAKFLQILCRIFATSHFAKSFAL